jgi:DNA-binding transcriptional regulator of glucitol operon
LPSLITFSLSLSLSLSLSPVHPLVTVRHALASDPHFQTWHGEWFSYHGACDLVLLKSKTFADGVGLLIHVRTEGRNLFSFIRNVAIQIGDDIFEIEGNGKPWDQSALVKHYYNSVQNAKLPISMIGKYMISKQEGKRRTFDTATYTIQLDHMQSIEVLVWKGFLHVSVTADVVSCGLEDSVGLMGTWNKMGKFSRDGVVNMTNPDDFAQEWQVLSSESMIFQTPRAPQHPEKCVPSAAERRRRRLGENEYLHNIAKEACANVESPRKELCVFDVMATEDSDMANSPFYITTA